MKKEMIASVFVLVFMISMSCFVVAETVEGTAFVSFESGNSDNPNVDASQMIGDGRVESNMGWVVALVVIVLAILVAYFFYSKRKVNVRKVSVVARKKR